MSKTLIRFYSGEAPDDRGRSLQTIQAWDAAKLEVTHNYIQWLFPLPEQSPVNPQAPLLDHATEEAFRSDPKLREALERSFRTMIHFYGFQLIDCVPPAVIPGKAFEEATANWLTPGNHNHLRITRILRSTRLLGLPEYTQAFFTALETLYRTPRGRRSIGEVSFRYWQRAAQS